MRHDEAFKILLSACPGDILPAFAPDLAGQLGAGAQITIESVEVLPRVKGLRRSRFIDFAVMLRWSGGATLLVLTEHFSTPSKVDLNRDVLPLIRSGAVRGITRLFPLPLSSHGSILT